MWKAQSGSQVKERIRNGQSGGKETSREKPEEAPEATRTEILKRAEPG
jgi:hypothetical protein